MRTKTRLEAWALWIVAFVLMSGVVEASGHLWDTVMYGQDQLPGFLRSYDNFYAETYAEIDGDSEITPDQVRFGPLETPADMCVSTLDGYKCTLSVSDEEYLPSLTTIPVKLYDDSGLLVNETLYDIVVDGYGPEVGLLLESEFTNGQQPVVVNYTIFDTAFPDSEVCSGIGGITISIVGETNETFELNLEDCFAEGSVELELSSDETSSEVCAVAYDRLMQSGAWECVTIGIDSTLPYILPDSLRFEFTDTPANNTFLAPGVAYHANVYVRVNEKHLSAEGVTGDFSAVNSQQSSYVLNASECYQVDVDLYECVFENVEIVLGSESNVGVVIQATDLAGNTAQSTLYYLFMLDSTGPEPLSLIINGQVGEPQWVGTSIPLVEADFLEEGVGLVASQVYLDLSSFGLGEVAANDCWQQDQGVWRCTWNNIQIGASTQEEGVIGIGLSTTDAIGNPLVGGLSVTVLVDYSPPEILSFNLTQPEAPFELPDNMYFEGIPLVMHAKVLEDKELLSVRIDPAWIKLMDIYNDTSLMGGLNITANVSLNFTADVSESCSAVGDGIWDCTYVLESPVPGVYDASYVFEDAAKNQVMQESDFTVVDLRQTETQYWNLGEVERMPSAVDRSTAPYINHQLLFLVPLVRVVGASSGESQESYSQLDTLRAQGLDVSPPATSVRLLKVLLGNCSGDTSYVLSNTIVDGSDLGEYPYIETILKKMEMPLRDLNLTCEIQLYSLITAGEDVWVNENPEVKSVVMEIPFYDTELPKEVLAQKFDEIKQSTVVRMTDNELFRFATQMVEWSKVAAKMDNALLQIAQGLEALAGLCQGLASGADICAFVSTFSQGAMSLHESVAPFIGWLTCDKTIVGELMPDSDWYKTWKNMGMFLGGDWMLEQGYTEEEITNPKRSLIASTAMLCLPGIVDNLKQMRDIECGYAYCIQEASKLGVPSDYCNEIRDYGWCVAMGEEVLYLMPLQHVYNDVAAAANSAFTSPLHLVAEGAGLICEWGGNVGIMQHVCNFILIGKMLNGVQMGLDVINNMAEYTAPVDYCALLENGNQ
ncbi:hypothetical protein DRJ48_00020 [Candidatus Woesearchaeota archaeon]|nr:hypothetical protein [Candidatus Woesearchaeota archaeon]RLE43715.1 MAG: hypothetical protein DRJ48_00020 [Candidatus Woesearchaeota archaeon]